MSLLQFALLLSLAGAVQAADTASPIGSWRSQMCANFFVGDPLPELKVETHRSFQPAPGVRAEAVTYGTQFGMRVPAVIYLPDPLPDMSKRKLPGFIVVNGHGGDKFSWYSFYTGILYARAGAVVLTYDPTGEGERNPKRKSGSRAHDMIKGDATLARRQAGLMITDVMQAVSCLAQRPEVDPQRIGAGGYSLGSFVLTLTGAMEPRLHACVVAGGGNLDGTNGYWDTSKPMCQGLPYQSLQFLGDRAAVIYAMQAARGPMLVYNGSADEVVNMPLTGAPFFADLQRRVTQLCGSGEGVFEYAFNEGTSHRPYFITRPVALWLNKQLAFPNWTEAGIQALPVTRIGDWAAKHGIFMDKLYATEDREDGTPALLNDVPGYTHEDLAVFPEAEWPRHRDEMSIETWLSKARAQ